jgi:hypothetical protein
MKAVDRANYVVDKRHAYEDSPQCVSPHIHTHDYSAVNVPYCKRSIGHDATISAPHMASIIFSHIPSTKFLLSSKISPKKTNSMRMQPSSSYLFCAIFPPAAVAAAAARAYWTSASDQVISQAYSTTSSASATRNHNHNHNHKRGRREVMKERVP